MEVRLKEIEGLRYEEEDMEVRLEEIVGDETCKCNEGRSVVGRVHGLIAV